MGKTCHTHYYSHFSFHFIMWMKLHQLTRLYKWKFWIWIYRLICEKYCEAMEKLCLVIMELLGIEGLHYRKFLEDGCLLMRCNYNPPCKEFDQTLGSGPHCDPTSITILHQDQVGGLQIFSNNKWQAIPPRSDAFVSTLVIHLRYFLFLWYYICLFKYLFTFKCWRLFIYFLMGT